MNEKEKMLMTLTVLSAITVGGAILMPYCLMCRSPDLTVQIQDVNRKTVFDFTHRDFFRGFADDISDTLYNFEVWEIDKQRHHLKLCWKIKATSAANKQLKTVVYGKVPEKFEEVEVAKPLRDGQLYEVTNGYVFVREGNHSRQLPKYGYLPYLVQ